MCYRTLWWQCPLSSQLQATPQQPKTGSSNYWMDPSDHSCWLSTSGSAPAEPPAPVYPGPGPGGVQQRWRRWRRALCLLLVPGPGRGGGFSSRGPAGTLNCVHTPATSSHQSDGGHEAAHTLASDNGGSLLLIVNIMNVPRKSSSTQLTVVHYIITCFLLLSVLALTNVDREFQYIS